MEPIPDENKRGRSIQWCSRTVDNSLLWHQLQWVRLLTGLGLMDHK